MFYRNATSHNTAEAKRLLKRVIKKYPQEEDARKLLDQIGA
jgi:hemerythrin superfamily protein